MTKNNYALVYTEWLASQIKATQVKHATELTFPFTNRLGDNLRLYVEPTATDAFIVSDDGNTVNELVMAQGPVDSAQQRVLIDQLTAQYDIILKDEILLVIGPTAEVAEMLQRLLQVVLRVEAMLWSTM